MKSPFSRFFLIVLLAARAGLPVAQNPFASADFFGKESGLSATIYCMVQDREGFYLVGAQNGLFQFDGLKARQIFLISEENTGIDHVSDLEYDAATNSIWLCSEQGIYQYDLGQKTAKRFDPKAYFPAGEISLRKECIFQDRQGLWWGDLQVNGLSCFDPAKNTVERYVVPDSLLGPHGAFALTNTVLNVAQDARNDSIIWAGTRKGLIRVNKVLKTFQYIQYRHPDFALEHISNAMTCLYSHPNGRLYIGTWNGGLLEYDPDGRQFRQFFPDPKGFDQYQEANHIYHIIPDGADGLWVTAHLGICRFNIPDARFSLIKKGGFLSYKDPAGNFWACKEVLVRFDRMQNDLPLFPAPAGEINLFQVDSAGQLIFCKQGGQPGVLVFDPARQQLRGLPFPGNNKPFTDGSILALTASGLLANDMEKLYLLPKGGSGFIRMDYALPVEAGWFTAKSMPDGGVVIAGDHGYLFHFGPELRTPELYPPPKVDGPAKRLRDNFSVLAVDPSGRAWLRSAAGFSIFDPRKRKFYDYAYSQMPDRIFPDIRGFCLDKQGRMWCISPNKLGWLDPARPEQGLQKCYGAHNGFQFVSNQRLRTNERGHIWFSTFRGLVRFDPQTETYQLYPAAGRDMTFLPDGRAVFNSIDGITIVHPDAIPLDTAAPRPYVTWVKVFDREKPLVGGWLSPREIRLAPHENFLSIGFSALGFYRQSDYLFAYQLVGINDDWVQSDPNNMVAAYTALPGGSYTFRLKVRDNTGRWSAPYQLRIYIATPWYKTWPAWLLYAGLAVLLARLWLRHRDRQLLMQQKLLEEKRETERLKELDTFKNRFFTNMTHELRTPLTVVLGMTDDLEAEANQERTVHEIKTRLLQSLPLIRRNGQRLLDLVNQIMELARLDAGSMPVQLERGDVMHHLRILVEAFHSFAVSQKIGLQFYADPERLDMDIDPELLQRIVSNLVSNALKYTPEYGNVLVLAKTQVDAAQGEQLLLEVRDSGVGIPPEQIPHVFDRFYQGNMPPLRGEESSGVGLALVKEIVQLLRGRVELESAIGQGSIFRVWLPVTREAAEKEARPMEAASVAAAGLYASHSAEPGLTEQPIALVIEDNADVLAYIRSCLTPYWNVLTARNGQEGLDLAREMLPDAIISDVMMPGLDGFALTQALKSELLTSHIPVLLLTAKSTRVDRLEGLSKGADDYLTKPFDKSELLIRLRNFYLQKLRWQSYATRVQSPDPFPPAERAFLDKVDAAIEKHLDEQDFKSEQLARAVALSRVQLHRKLSALAGVSTGLYIRRYRLKRANELLVSTDLPVSEVAWKVGFENLSWFSQAYRECFGESPRDTRKS